MCAHLLPYSVAITMPNASCAASYRLLLELTFIVVVVAVVVADNTQHTAAAGPELAVQRL